MQVVAIVVSLVVTLVALPLITKAVREMLKVIRTGKPVIGRRDNPVKRTTNMLIETFGHTRMLQWHWIGILHWFAYAAFLILSTAVAQAFFQLFDADFAWPIIGKFFLYEWLAEVIGLLGALAILPLIVYRQVKHPRRLQRKSRFFGSRMGQAYFVEAMVFIESIAILFIRGAEYNLAKAHGGEHAEHATGFHFPISQYFGNLFPTGPDSIGTLENIIYVIAMIKIVSAMVWLIVIALNLTMGVAWHRFLAWPNIWFKRNSSGKTALGGLQPIYVKGKPLDLEDMDDLDEEDFAGLGVGKVEDFTWKGILDFSTCTECGRCQSQCPAWATDKPLSPKLLIMGLREHAYAKAPLLALSEEEQANLTDEQKQELERPLIGDESMYGVIDPDVLWSCTNCGACVQQCPVDIEHVDHIDDMRRFQVLVESNFPAELNNIFKGLERKGNPWGMAPKDRMDWAKGLDFEVKQVGKDIEDLDEVEWLFWVGCAGAYEDRAKKTTQAVAELLDMAGVSFAVLGDGETCTGDSARRAGNEIVFQQLAMQNAEVFKETKVKKVVSTCAHCFNTLKNEYAEFGVELEVVHHTQLLNRLVREGKLTPVAPDTTVEKKKITYHDPCFLGRHNQVYEAPRELLSIIPGTEFTEMPRNQEKSFCCGAGGARMWMEETIGSRINVNRTEEAIATGADQIAVGCPFCRVMLSDGLTLKQSEGQAREEVEIIDVAQMLLAGVKRAPEPEVVEAEPNVADEANPASISDTAAVGAAAAASDPAKPEPAAPVDDQTVAAEHNVEVNSDGAAVDTPESDAATPASEKEDAAWANVGAVNADLVPTEDNKPEVEIEIEAEAKPAADELSQPEPPAEIIAVADAESTADPVSADHVPLSKANPSGDALTASATEAVPDVDHQQQDTEADAVEEWVEEGGTKTPPDDETKP